MTPPSIAKTRQLPFVTISLIVTHLLLFGYTLTLNVRELAQFVRQWAILPVQLFTQFPTEFFTLATAPFIHGSWVHFVSNCLAIAVFGRLVEAHFRPIYTIFLYFTCAFGATIAQLLIEPANATPIMGASGAIAGLLGATITIPQTRILHSNLLLLASLWFIMQQLNALLLLEGVQFQLGSSAFFAVAGGFITSILLGKRLRMAATINT